MHDKYRCNGCSALLSIRPVNVAAMTYHYFLFSSLQHSLPPPDCHQPLLAPTTSHLLTSSLGDKQTEEQPERRFKHPAMCSEYTVTEPQLLQNSTVPLCLLMNCLVYSLMLCKSNRCSTSSHQTGWKSPCVIPQVSKSFSHLKQGEAVKCVASKSCRSATSVVNQKPFFQSYFLSHLSSLLSQLNKGVTPHWGFQRCNIYTYFTCKRKGQHTPQLHSLSERVSWLQYLYVLMS